MNTKILFLALTAFSPWLNTSEQLTHFRSIPQESLNLLTANTTTKQTIKPATRIYQKKRASKPDETFKRCTDIAILCVGAALFLSWFRYGFTQEPLHTLTANKPLLPCAAPRLS